MIASQSVLGVNLRVAVGPGALCRLFVECADRCGGETLAFSFTPLPPSVTRGFHHQEQHSVAGEAT